jgi:hypothetical protein
MTREIACSQCGRSIIVAGKGATGTFRCPDCERRIVGESTSVHSTPEAADHENVQDTEWYLLTPEGPIYGPITWPQVEQWSAEGRIDADCQLGTSAAGPWRAASERLPLLRRSSRPGSTESASPGGGNSTSDATAPPIDLRRGDGYAPAAADPGLAPHRGIVIFILGLMGLVIGCPVFSFAAWAMATRDLTQMRMGRMDRSGEGLTLGGFILGLIASLMWFVCLFGVLLVLLVYAARRL